MNNSGTSVFSNALIWFGAAVSIAEILTGTLIAPLGFEKGLAAVVLGHAVGCALLYAAGLIGAKSRLSAMETVKLAFGQKGSLLFSSLNVLQLVGWTAVMIASGAAAAQSVIALPGVWAWCAVIGVLIAVWVVIGIKNLGVINGIAMTALFALTIVLSTVIFKSAPQAVAGEMTFGTAVELSAAMPLSWLPLISDYTRAAQRPRAASVASAAVYFAASCWMYVIGMGAAICTGESDIAKIMVSAGLGIAALVIVIFSTVTTTFLDVYSAGVSCESISRALREKPMALAVCAAGTVLAALTPVSEFETFLYLIGSVFAPMIAVQLVDFFVLKYSLGASRPFCVRNLAVWAVGFVLYRWLMNFDTPVGVTFPVMLITAAIALAAGKLFPSKTAE